MKASDHTVGFEMEQSKQKCTEFFRKKEVYSREYNWFSDLKEKKKKNLIYENS